MESGTRPNSGDEQQTHPADLAPADPPDLHDLAAQTAGALGDGWSIALDAPSTRRVRVDRAELVHRDGRRLTFEYSSPHLKSQVIVSGRLPYNPADIPAYLPRVATPHITADTSGGPQALADDIAQRLLPVYAGALSQAGRLLQRHDDVRAERARTARQITTVIGAGGSAEVEDLPPDHNAARIRWTARAGWPHGAAMITLHGNAATADMELRNIPRKTTLAICALLQAAASR
jgi:hypothetical protein